MPVSSRRLRRVFPVGLVALGVVGIVLLVLRPWSGADEEQSPRPRTSESGPWVDAGEVRGTVLHDGKPLEGVKVGLYGGDAATHPAVSTVSDAGGRFRLVGVPPDVDLLLETSGAQPGGGREGSEWTPVTPVPIRLSGERGVGGVELVVSRTNEVTGRLLQKNGTPVVGVDVIAYRRASQSKQEVSGSERDEWGRVATDERGRFVLTRIPDGEWWISADETFGFAPRSSADSGTQATDATQKATLATFVPIRTATEGRVSVSGGSRVKVPTLEVAPGRVVSGVVKDAKGVPVVGALVSLQVPGEQWLQVRTSATDERGRYSFIRLRPVRVRVTALDPQGRSGSFPDVDAAPRVKGSTFAVKGRSTADVVVTEP